MKQTYKNIIYIKKKKSNLPLNIKTTKKDGNQTETKIQKYI